MRLRDERRAAYMALLGALDRASEVWGASLSFHEAKDRDASREDDTDAYRLPERADVARCNLALLNEMRVVGLLATAGLADLAHALVTYQCEVMWSDWSNEKPGPHQGVTYAGLESAMRRELGIQGGHEVDRETGFVVRQAG